MGLKVSGDGQLEEAEDGVQVVDVGERAEERDAFVDAAHVQGDVQHPYHGVPEGERHDLQCIEGAEMRESGDVERVRRKAARASVEEWGKSTRR